MNVASTKALCACAAAALVEEIGGKVSAGDAWRAGSAQAAERLSRCVFLSERNEEEGGKREERRDVDHLDDINEERMNRNVVWKTGLKSDFPQRRRRVNNLRSLPLNGALTFSICDPPDRGRGPTARLKSSQFSIVADV